MVPSLSLFFLQHCLCFYHIKLLEYSVLHVLYKSLVVLLCFYCVYVSLLLKEFLMSDNKYLIWTELRRICFRF